MNRRSRRRVSVVGVAAPLTSVTCSFRFEAAHTLAWHPGKCRNLHGHSYRLDVTVSGPLDGNGVVIDFDRLHEIVDREVVGQWDHRDLNQVLDNPTAELLAHRAWELLTDAGVTLSALRLWETDDLVGGADRRRTAPDHGRSSGPPVGWPRLDGVHGHGPPGVGIAPLALTFDYGQRHRTELDRSAGVAGHFRSEHLVVTLDTSAWGGSALTDPSIDIPAGGDADDGIPVTYVPARNSIFLAVALGVAEARGLDAVWIGVNAIDYSGYPDCRPEFIEAFRGVAATGQKRGVEGRAHRHPDPADRIDQGGDRPHWVWSSTRPWA